MLTDRRTWTTMLYLLLMLPLGVAYFTIAVVGLAFPFALLTGAVEGATIREPAVTIVTKRDPRNRIVALGGEMLAYQKRLLREGQPREAMAEQTEKAAVL